MRLDFGYTVLLGGVLPGDLWRVGVHRRVGIVGGFVAEFFAGWGSFGGFVAEFFAGGPLPALLLSFLPGDLCRVGVGMIVLHARSPPPKKHTAAANRQTTAHFRRIVEFWHDPDSLTASLDSLTATTKPPGGFDTLNSRQQAG